MFLTLTAVLLAAATPAIATDTPAPAPPVKAAAAAANPRVCFVDEVTGSRLRIKTCKRLHEWRAEGIDPLPKR